ncbi:MAG: patatin-like phospholipase family protein [Acidimicrobiia bacterium]|nr:patatin-like phospholipase family protein [Acidimicrobiia bacterium]
MPSVAVVLGAGGIVGGAWSAGVLAELYDQCGLDARQASLLVGTSAGASLAATLRLGISPDDLARRMSGQRLSDHGATFAGLAPGAPHEPTPDLPAPPSRAWRDWRPQSPRLVAAGLLRVGEPRFGLALAGLVPTGNVANELVSSHLRPHMEGLPGGWPTAATWLCTVRLDDGRRVVLGRDARPDADLASAVEASAAVPGYFSPVELDGRRYIDGGSHSATNADLTAGLGFDLVVVISPLTGTRPTVGGNPTHLARALRSRVLAREVAAVRRTGSRVLVIQPSPEDLPSLSGNPLSGERGPEATTTGRRSAHRRLSQPDSATARALLAGIADSR